MTEQFAKLYDTHLGQVLVKIDEDENGPEVRFYMKPKELGVCSMAFNFTDSDEGWTSARTMFDGMTQDKAESIASKVLQAIVDEAEEPETEIELRGLGA